ncbi:MAG: lytic transglycosylase domain-containing protein [Acetobacterales bacterium]
MLRPFFGILVAAASLAGMYAASAAGLSDSEAEAVRAALSASNEAKWNRAREAADRTHSAPFRKYVRWLYLGGADSRASFEEIVAFLEENPDWPGRAQLLQRAEEALSTADPARVAGWFRSHPPRTTQGRVKQADALIGLGEKQHGEALLRGVWLDGVFSPTEERDFLRRYGRLFERADHEARLDHLIWDRQLSAADRMLPHVGEAERALGVARLRLARLQPGVDAAIGRVPDSLQADPGLVFERVKWRRRKNRYDEAMALLLEPGAEQGQAESWWTERDILSRWALRQGYVSEAYRLASHHGLQHGADYVEAEWLAGWIALRFLAEPDTAFRHFINVYESSFYPVSRARGAYWAGRASEARGSKVAGQSWYRTAANYATTYYGQLAAEHLSGDARPLPPDAAEPAIDAAVHAEFRQRELVRLIEVLVGIGARDRLADLLLHLDDIARTTAERHMIGALARESGRADLTLQVGKRALRDNLFIPAASFPIVQADMSGDPEPALLMAMIRQESAFHPGAISIAGASGMMQLMPATARAVARREGLPYSRDRLLQDPDYNIRLGASYMQGLLSRFDGSYPLSLAGYNAGPNRVAQWVRAYGDPRLPDTDEIDWIEMIPFSETRNYVQRVLENLTVYRYLIDTRKLAGQPVAGQ